MAVIEYIKDHPSEIVAVLTGVVTIASFVANLTPTETDNKVVRVVGKVVNWLAVNWAKPLK